MSNLAFDTPVLLLIFNRPDCTQVVFDAISKQKPRFLYIAADGPRQNQQDDYKKCLITRKIVLDNIDWECEVKTLLRDENLGCGKSVSQAITWFFDQVEEGIILEDDCLPDKSFFYFCQEMLERYRVNDKVMHIGGNNFQNKDRTGNCSYYFSNYIHIWGWATWKRAWKTYQLNIPVADSEFNQLLADRFPDKIERQFWENSFAAVARHEIDTWDTQWIYNIFIQHGVGITPSKNLILNIGFGSDATHTHVGDKHVLQLKLHTIGPILHPKKIKVKNKYDRVTYRKLYQFGNTRFNRIKFKIGQTLPFVKSIYLNMYNTINLIKNS